MFLTMFFYKLSAFIQINEHKLHNSSFFDILFDLLDKGMYILEKRFDDERKEV